MYYDGDVDDDDDDDDDNDDAVDGYGDDDNNVDGDDSERNNVRKHDGDSDIHSVQHTLHYIIITLVVNEDNPHFLTQSILSHHSLRKTCCLHDII